MMCVADTIMMMVFGRVKGKHQELQKMIEACDKTIIDIENK
jgi:hypothetical protein